MDDEYGSHARQLAITLRAEIAGLLGISSPRWWRRMAEAVFWPLARRFGQLAAEFDAHVAERGLREAAKWIMPRFTAGLQVFGEANLPCEGPLLIAANHPGSVDGLAIASCVQRDDLCVVATGREFVRSMVATCRHLILTPREGSYGRMAVVRAAIRHLREGGALLLFPGGRVEPDPEVVPGAMPYLDRWSRSLEIILRAAPEARLQIATVSGVVAARFLRNPIVRMRRGLSERLALAEMFQIMEALYFPGWIRIIPRLSFSKPLVMTQLPGSDTFSAIIEQAKSVYLSHLNRAVEPSVV
jgi:hypothetical protein